MTGRIATIIALGAGLGIGLGAGGAAVVRHAPTGEAADSVTADSASVTADSLLMVSDTVAAETVDSIATTAPAAEPVLPPPPSSADGLSNPSVAGPRDTAPDTAQARLSRILASMEPADAAELLAAMESSAAVRALLGMSERRAAAILARLPADDAAALMSGMIDGAP